MKRVPVCLHNVKWDEKVGVHAVDAMGGDYTAFLFRTRLSYRTGTYSENRSGTYSGIRQINAVGNGLEPGRLMGRLPGPGRADLKIVTGRAGRVDDFEIVISRAGLAGDI